MTYKKLFSIKYNSQRFMIFIDENNRQTFLEINNQGEYEYPMLEDFVALHNMFNNQEPYICYNIQKFRFKECVKVVKNGVLSLLTVITILNSMPNALAANQNLEITDDSIVISETISNEEYKYVRPKNQQELEEQLGKINLTKELVLEAIENNNNLPKDIKEVAKEQFETFYKMHPEANYRKFYENVKDLKVRILTPEEFKEESKKMPGADAYFNWLNKEITLQSNYTKTTLCHELAHTYQHLHIKIENTTIEFYDNYTALNEGMTEIMTNYTIPKESKGSYKISQEIVEFLSSISGYTFEDYMNYGIDNLIDKCEEMYPDIDFRYIASTAEILKRAEVYENIKIEQDPIEMYDELFKVALKQVNINNIYEPFIKFLDCLSELKDRSIIDSYFKKYTQALEQIGYFNTSHGQKIKKNISLYDEINSIIYSTNNEFEISLGIVKENKPMQRINADGTLSECKNCGGIKLDSTSKIRILTGGENISENIVNYLRKIKGISKATYMSLPITINKKLLTTTMITDLRIQIGFNDNNDLGFIISNQKGNIIYQTEEKLNNLSDTRSFFNYLSLYQKDNYEEVELNEVLTKEYLKSVQQKDKIFDNIEIVDEKVKFKELETTKQDKQEQENNKESIVENNSISEIYINNEVIAKVNVKDLFLTIGKTKDGKIGYILSNKAGIPIYESAEVIEKLSNPINFEEYTGPGFSKMFLEDYLNEDYLRNFQKETGKFNNLELIGDKIVIDNSVKIIIQSKVNERVINSTYKLSKLKIYIKNGIVTVSSLTNMPDIDSYDLVIDVEDILKYSNMLDKGVSIIRLTKDDLMEITEKYINDLNSNLDEGSIIR